MESVNAIISGFHREVGSGQTESDIETSEKEFLFHPSRSNVAFVSGTDTWGFTLKDFLPIVKRLTECNDEDVLLEVGSFPKPPH